MRMFTRDDFALIPGGSILARLQFGKSKKRHRTEKPRDLQA